jgi:ABC-type nickel/cobalt efflux system permease component RcnA
MGAQASDKIHAITTDNSSDHSSQDAHPHHHVAAPWKPSYIRRRPLLGLGSMLGVLLCTGAVVGVLVASNGMSSSRWTQKLGPNVCIQAITSVSTLLLGVAIVNGIAIAWWRKVSSLKAIGMVSARSVLADFNPCTRP